MCTPDRRGGPTRTGTPRAGDARGYGGRSPYPAPRSREEGPGTRPSRWRRPTGGAAFPPAAGGRDLLALTFEGRLGGEDLLGEMLRGIGLGRVESRRPKRRWRQSGRVRTFGAELSGRGQGPT